ncbi:BPI fold-containing family B member 6 [Ornithorhynchus anatinus]|uniref:BPI fold-containing family B member 6 n=1 Tax=Ornithorhynchus anatinus TaxID=9258 RepID=UPI0010A75762|nr:BPI fold-containing family B member 6 [Ornithorhynchus anatinus]
MWTTRFLLLSVLAAPACGDPGVRLRLGMDLMNRVVQDAVEESQVLQRMAAEASKKTPGAKAIKGISGIAVKGLGPPIITLEFLPGVGIFQCVSTKIFISGKSFTGGKMEISLVLNITATDRLLMDNDTGLPVLQSEGCVVVLVSVKTNLPSNMLPKMVNKFLDSTLQKMLPSLMCPAIDIVLKYVNKKWENLQTPTPMGEAGNVTYSVQGPLLITPAYIQVQLSPTVQAESGPPMKIPDDGAVHTPEDFAPGSSQLILSPAFFEAGFLLLKNSFNADVDFPPSQPLKMRVKLNDLPKMSMKPSKSLLQFHGTVALFKSKPSPLVVLRARFNLGVQFSVTGDRVRMTTALDRFPHFSVASSSIGGLDKRKLRGLLIRSIRTVYVPAVNDPGSPRALEGYILDPRGFRLAGSSGILVGDGDVPPLTPGALRAGFPLPNVLAANYSRSELSRLQVSKRQPAGGWQNSGGEDW